MFKLKKHSGGPVLSPAKNLDWEKEGVFNPGVIKDGEEIIMLYRAVGERESYISRLGLAKSRDGINFERVSNDPVFGPGEFFDHWSTEDPRIVKIDNEFLITYVAVADRIMKNGRSILRPLPLETASALLKTKDFSLKKWVLRRPVLIIKMWLFSPEKSGAVMPCCIAQTVGPKNGSPFPMKNLLMKACLVRWKGCQTSPAFGWLGLIT